MDDLMTGADSVEECKQIQKEVSLQLAKFGLPIRKWISNNNTILEAIPNKGNIEVVPINSDEAVKTLGLQWHPNKDVFMFNIKADHNARVTKRRALSTLARIFDPIGWLAPFTASVKLFIQKLWIMKTNWDDEINNELQKEWDLIMRSLPSLREQVIPRWYKTTRSSKVELHGFADASQKAYAAVVYIKVDGIISLVAGKSKVNPVKNQKTLPKLELCAAHLLAKLTGRILSIMQRQVEVNAWSDSTITLAWIVNNKSKDRFIKSRVDEIKTLLPHAIWRHVDTKSNPADEASRGVSADKISRMWWTGPSWLKCDRSQWPSQNNQKITLTTRAQRTECWLQAVSIRCSSFRKLERVIAYVKRFIGKLKRKKYPNWLTSEELKIANYVIVCQHQEHYFFSEIMSLRQQKEVDSRSKIANLHPFLDEDGILRVGGRLRNSELPYNHKHPMLLEKSYIAELIIKEIHTATLHGGNSIDKSTEVLVYGYEKSREKSVKILCKLHQIQEK